MTEPRPNTHGHRALTLLRELPRQAHDGKRPERETSAVAHLLGISVEMARQALEGLAERKLVERRKSGATRTSSLLWRAVDDEQDDDVRDGHWPRQTIVAAADAPPPPVWAARSVFELGGRIDPMQRVALDVLPQLGDELVEQCHKDVQTVVANVRAAADQVEDATAGDAPLHSPAKRLQPAPVEGEGHAERRPDPAAGPAVEVTRWAPKPPRFAFDNLGRLTIETCSCTGALTADDARELVRYLALFKGHPVEAATT